VLSVHSFFKHTVHERPPRQKVLKVIRYEERRVDEEGGRSSYLASLAAQKVLNLSIICLPIVRKSQDKLPT